jgi:hypothetical protein
VWGEDEAAARGERTGATLFVPRGVRRDTGVLGIAELARMGDNFLSGLITNSSKITYLFDYLLSYLG